MHDDGVVINDESAAASEPLASLGALIAEGDSNDLVRTASDALELLTALDPIGLRPGRVGGTPDDEYAPEAVALARILLTHGNITVQEVEDVWSRSFSESLVARLGSSHVAGLTRDLNRLRRVHE